jgi:pimeloyl-ACP methyl ester carboxylesterase
MTHESPSRHLDPGAGLREQAVRLPDGRRIRTVLAGDAPGPLVVFEAGMSAPAAEWLVVQRGVSAHARTLAYDRAGYGGSDRDDHPRTLERMADDLRDTLEAAGERGPVVLVAHSWGGPIARVFARRHPERMAGVVLVDASLAAFTATRRQAFLGELSFRITSLLLRLGAVNTVVRMALPHGPSAAFSDADMAVLTRDYASIGAMRTGVQEVRQLMVDRALLEELQDAGFPDIPVVSVQGGRLEPSASARRFRDAFNAAAEALARRQAQGRFVIAEGAGHLVPQEQPEVVVAAVLDVLAAHGAAS